MTLNRRRFLGTACAGGLAALGGTGALAQVEPILNPPQPDPAASPFAALKNWKG